MNELPIVTLILAVVAAAALAWAIRERMRAASAQMRLDHAERDAATQAELVRAQAAQSASAVAERRPISPA